MLRDAARPRRTRPRATVRFAALLATAVGLVMTTTVVAAADPSPSPAPSASPTASATPVSDPSATEPSAATATPSEPAPSSTATEPTPATTPGPDERAPADGSPSETPSATPSTTSPASTPTPSEPSASTTRDSGSLAERALRKYPWIQLPASAAREPAARPPAARPPAAPGQLEAFVLPFECQQGAAPVTAQASVLNVGDQTADVFYEVSRAGSVAASGALSIPPEDEVDFTIDGLTAGTYQLTFSNGEGGPPVLTVEFRVLECITTSVTCAAITFTNPASNPEVQVLYGDFEEDEPDGEATLAPGQAVTVPTTRTVLDYIAFILDEGSEDLGISFAGTEEDVAIPNGACRAEIDSIDTDCATAGEDDGSARAEVEIVAGQQIRYEVTRAGRSRVVARASAPARDEDREVTVEFDDLSAGSYVLRVYVGDEDESTDRERFTVKECKPAPAPAAPEAPAATEPLAATGGVSPLLGVGALLATLGGGALLLVRNRRQRGR